MHACPLITRMHDTLLTWVEFSRTFINTIADWSEMKTCETGYTVNQFFQVFRRHFEVLSFKHLLGKQMKREIIVRLMMVLRLRKTGCKQENWAEKIAIERQKLSHKCKEFQRAILLVTKGLETSSLPGYTRKKRTSNYKVYHVEFPHNLEPEVKTIHFVGGDCN